MADRVEQTYLFVEVEQMRERLDFVVRRDLLVLLVRRIYPSQGEVGVLLLIQQISHLLILRHEFLGLLQKEFIWDKKIQDVVSTRVWLRESRTRVIAWMLVLTLMSQLE